MAQKGHSKSNRELYDFFGCLQSGNYIPQVHIHITITKKEANTRTMILYIFCAEK